MRTVSLQPTGHSGPDGVPAALPRAQPFALRFGRVTLPLMPTVLAVGMAVTAVGFWHLGRGMTFFYDEWDVILRRRFDGGSLLRPHNNHLIAVPVAIYRLVIGAFGLEHYGVVRALLIGLHLLCAGLLYRYAAVRVGRFLALLAAGFLLASGRAWEDLLWGFEITVMLCVAAALGVLCCLDRRDRPGDLGACLLLSGSLASFGFGVPLAIGVGVELAARHAWRRLWVVGVPTAFFGLWYLTHPSDRLPVAGVGKIAGFISDAAATAVAALTGRFSTWPVFAFGLLAVLVVGLGRRFTDRPRLLLVATTLAAYWGLTAYSRASLVPTHATSSRYLYPAAAFVLVGLADTLRGVRVNLLAASAGAALLAVAVAGNVGALRDGATGLRYESALLRASLGALELVPNIDPEFTPNPRQPQVWAGQYLQAAERHGSAGSTLSELREAGPEAQAFADDTLVRALAPRLDAFTGSSRGGDCVGVSGPDHVAEAPASPGRVVVRAGASPAQVHLRRFSSAFAPQPIGALEPNTARLISIPGDRAPDVWHVRAAGPGASLCRIHSGG